MTGQPATVTLQVGAHTFQVRCDDERERAQMHAAARTVDAELTSLKKNSEVTDGERAAIMTALKIAAEKAICFADDADVDRINKALDQGIADLESAIVKQHGSC